MTTRRKVTVMRNRGVVGALECVTCFERSCFGCALTAPPVGVCHVCGLDICMDDSWEWMGVYLAHSECMDEMKRRKYE